MITKFNAGRVTFGSYRA